MGEALKTMRSLVGALADWVMLRIPQLRMVFTTGKPREFAFLVHPRTDDLRGEDVYGGNDIYRPYPMYRHLPEWLVRAYAKWVVPITLARISLRRFDGRVIYGSLLSTVRTPAMLVGPGKGPERRRHLQDLFGLASAQRAKRVGWGALLPSMIGYGTKITRDAGSPSQSTGHAYTAFVICQYLLTLLKARERKGVRVRIAIVGAAGSTGSATTRMLKRRWPKGWKIKLYLVDLPLQSAKLRELQAEMQPYGDVAIAYDHSCLRDCEYVIVVTNGESARIRAESINPGTVIIDDSQPRNTGMQLIEKGCAVVDVLARVTGLDCHFDFGFRTTDASVTFTCLAETAIAAAVGLEGDLAVGPVSDITIEHTLHMVKQADALGLIGELPWFSFGRELTGVEQNALLSLQYRTERALTVPAAE